MRIKLAWLAGLAAAMTAAAPSPASVALIELQQSYDVLTRYDLHHAISYNRYGAELDGSGMTNSYNIDAPGGTIVDYFPKSSANPPVLTYIMGTSNLGEDTETDGHLIIGFNDVFAAGLLAAGQDFTATFGGYDESSLIAALTLLDTPDLPTDDENYEAQRTAKQNASSLLFGFSDTVYQDGGLTTAAGGSLMLVSFSTPGLAGTGTANLTPIGSAVPEPATWLLLIGGFGAVGVAMRRRRTMAITIA